MQEKLTEEQKKLVEQNYNLIYGFCKLHKIDKDEYSDILSLALCESAMRYDNKKKLAFSTYTYFLMSNRMKNMHRAKKRYILNTPEDKDNFIEKNYDDINDLFDTISSVNDIDEIENFVMYKCILEDIRNKANLSDKQKQVLNYLLLGLTNKEMHLALNCSLRYTEKLRRITKDKIGKFILSEYEDI